MVFYVWSRTPGSVNYRCLHRLVNYNVTLIMLSKLLDSGQQVRIFDGDGKMLFPVVQEKSFVGKVER